MNSQELAEVQAGFLNFARHCAATPGGEMGEDSGCHWFSTPINFPAYSGVGMTRARSDADAAIDRTIERLNSKKMKWGWFLTPQCRPSDLAQRLEARGFRSVVQLTGMAADFGEIVPTPENADKIEIREAVGDDDLRAYASIYPMLFEPEDRSFFPSVVEAELCARSKTRRYIALRDGKPISAGSTTSDGEVATLDTLCTLPEERNRGVGAVLALTALRNEQANGATRATIWAGPGAEKLYSRLGFRTVFPIDIFMATG